MSREFFRWWIEQLRELIPARLRRRPTEPASGLVVICRDPAGATIECRARRRRRERSLGTAPLDAEARRAAAFAARRGVLLRVPAGVMLERQVTLPLAAEADVERVAEYEMDRFTPFTADEVFWSARILRRERAEQRLVLAITLVPRAALQVVLEALARLGVAPTEIEGKAAGGRRRIPLARADARRRRRALALAGGAVAGLAVAAAGLPFLRQTWTEAAVGARIAALQPRVAEAEALRHRLATAAAGSDVVSAEQARVGDALQAIAAVTDLLPDDTFLTGFSLRQRQLAIEGQSAGAARLIAALSAEPLVRNAAFSAPVTKSEGGADVFSIRAELHP